MEGEGEREGEETVGICLHHQLEKECNYQQLLRDGFQSTKMMAMLRTKSKKKKKSDILTAGKVFPFSSFCMTGWTDT